MPLYVDKLTGREFFFSLPSATGGTSYNLITASASLTFGSTGGQTNKDLTITLTGAAVGDPVILGVPNGAVFTNSCYTAWVSATNTVTVRFNNYDVGPKSPTANTFKVSIIK